MSGDETGHAKGRETGRARVAAIEIGGSILRGSISCASAAQFIKQRITATREERLVVVVSAQDGVTDALLREARAIVHEPDAAAGGGTAARRAQPARGCPRKAG